MTTEQAPDIPPAAFMFSEQERAELEAESLTMASMKNVAIAGRDYFMETLGVHDNVLRRVDEGIVQSRLGGYSRAWIPDRRPGEVRLQVVNAAGTRIALATLTDDKSEVER